MRTKRSNRCARCSRAIAAPRFSTSMRNDRGFSTVREITVSSRAAWRNALPTRLPSARSGVLWSALGRHHRTGAVSEYSCTPASSLQSRRSACPRRRRRAKLQKRSHPRQQLGVGEGLGQVVVGAGFESPYAVLYRVARRQEQNRGAAAGVARSDFRMRRPSTSGASRPDRQVVATSHRQVMPVKAVARQVYDEAGFVQTLAKTVRGDGFVLDDQQLQGRPSRALGVCSRTSPPPRHADRTAPRLSAA